MPKKPTRVAMMHDKDEPVYMISVVAQMLHIHPQTLRQYEKDGLISPSRTKGSARLYSQRDLLKMKLILQLIRDFGINVAGVHMILKLKENEKYMNQEISTLRKELTNISKKGSEIEKSITVHKHFTDIAIEWCE